MTDRQTLVNNLVEKVATELPAWLPAQRWFAGKDRPVTAVRPITSTSLLWGDPTLLHVVVLVEQEGRAERYQLLIGARAQLPEHLNTSWLGSANGLLCYEASGDADLTGHLLDLMVAGDSVGALSFEHEPGAELSGGLRARPITSEQSNTSLVFGSQYILKLYRKLSPGLNPDLKLHRALREVGSEHVAPPLGAITGDLDGRRTTVAMLQQFVGDAVDGWAMATTSVRDLMADRTLSAAEVGGDFAGEAQRLGHAVATVHAELREALGQHEVDDDEFGRTVDAMKRRLVAVVADVPELAGYAPALSAAFEQLRAVKSPVYMQFIHGDLHLGQVLRTANGWLTDRLRGRARRPGRRAGRVAVAAAGRRRHAAFLRLRGQSTTRRATGRGRAAHRAGPGLVAPQPRGVLRGLRRGRRRHDRRPAIARRPAACVRTGQGGVRGRLRAREPA